VRLLAFAEMPLRRTARLPLVSLLGVSLALAAPLPHAFSAQGLPGNRPGTGVDAASARRITSWALEEYAVPGAAIALVRDGRLVLAEGLGVRDLATGAPTTADTVFQLASVSKTFTAATVAFPPSSATCSITSAMTAPTCCAGSAM